MKADCVERGERIFLRQGFVQRNGGTGSNQGQSGHVELQVDSETHEELLRLIDMLQARWGRRVTIDEAIVFLCGRFLLRSDAAPGCVVR